MSKITLFASNDRKAHESLTSIIPAAFWNEYFYNAILDVDLNLLVSEPEGILNILRNIDSLNLSITRKRCCWLVLMFMDIEFSILQTATKILDINIAEWAKQDNGLLIKLSAGFKDSSILEKIFQISKSFEIKDDHICEIYNSVFELACMQGNLKAVDNFFKSEFLSNLHVNFKFSLKLAVKNGHAQIVKRFLEYNKRKASYLPDYDTKSLFGDLSYEDTVESYLKGNKDVLEYLLNDNFFVEMIIEKLFIFQVVYHDHSMIFDRFLELDLVVLKKMIMAKEFEVFEKAVDTKKLQYIHKLLDKFPDLVDEMIPPHKYFYFDKIMQIDKDCAIRLIRLSNNIFDHLDNKLYFNNEEYLELVDSYIKQFLNDMRASEFNYKCSNDSKNFAMEGFYIARNLISRNNPKDLEDIKYLINTPNVKQLLCAKFGTVLPNQLLIRALLVDNSDVVNFLLEIPEVKDLAEKKDYYKKDIAVLHSYYNQSFSL